MKNIDTYADMIFVLSFIFFHVFTRVIIVSCGQVIKNTKLQPCMLGFSGCEYVLAILENKVQRHHFPSMLYRFFV